MGCFPWGKDSTKRSKNKTKYNALNQKDDRPETALDTLKVAPAKIEDSTKAVDVSVVTNELEANRGMNNDGMIRQMNAKAFKFSQIVDATENFKRENYLGQGGFGKVYKGKLKDTGELLAFKQLDCDGTQGIREFVVEVLTLSLVDHPNLVKLVGYCVDEGQKLLVYEYMPLGSLEAHLHGPKQKLDWNTRMKIAAGAAKGLAYLHDTLNPPIIYRDLKCSNLLLGEDYHPKLSDFGLAKVGPTGNNTHVSTRVMGTYGYCAPEYAMTGQLTFKSDIYSLGVFLLEIITGRKAIDNTRSAKEHNLVSWARPLFKDKKNIFQMVDPALKGQYPTKSLYKAFATAVMCVQEQPTLRPLISEVVKALDHIVSQPYNPPSPPAQNTPVVS